MIDFCVVKVFIVLLEANPSLGQSFSSLRNVREIETSEHRMHNAFRVVTRTYFYSVYLHGVNRYYRTSSNTE